MAEAKSFTFYADPSHGWLKVSEADIRDLGMVPREFSSYSYESFSGEFFYLEEDCDAGKFLTAYKAKHGEPVIKESFCNSPSKIRNMARVQSLAKD